MTFLTSCKNKQTPVSFYHWKQSLHLSDNELSLLQELNSQPLYVRVFDIDFKDKSQEPAFLSALTVTDEMLPDIEIIPCIYITNRSFRNVDYISVDSLAHQTSKMLNRVLHQNKITQCNELQIDCDWSGETRSYFFTYLKQLRKYLPSDYLLSSTIRLHQFKYPGRTGVPPVDKGSLMVYNMGDFANKEAPNSIYDLNILKQYLQGTKSYPLPLDIAMPAFNWALVFRFGKAMKIIHQVEISKLDSENERFKKMDQNRFVVLISGYFQGLYLYKGDELRVDAVSSADIEKGLQMFKKYTDVNPKRILFYHLNKNLTQQYTYDDFKKFSAVFN
nr:hypothetical protein [uncultured Carboxylicivirga sp.]